MNLRTEAEVYEALAAGWDFEIEHPETKEMISVQYWASQVEAQGTGYPQLVWRVVAKALVDEWTHEERIACYKAWFQASNCATGVHQG